MLCNEIIKSVQIKQIYTTLFAKIGSRIKTEKKKNLN